MFYRLLLILLLTSSVYAQERIKIGLVLSGGGARGGAHLGVIKEFEKHRIPIDGIVGTSMGAFVGGLYASGMSSAEIETILTTTQWKDYIAMEYDRNDISFRRKTLQRDFPGKIKVGVNAENDIVLGTGLFKRQVMLQYLEKKTHRVVSLNDFDNLRIPFRAVASDLESGKKVVLRSGSLAESIYASIAIPGGFDPIVIDGQTLVDGGVADNLPLDVMRSEMDMDIIVVIDISTPFAQDPRFDNILSVLSQLSDILMRKNVEQTIDSMKENEILITPDLKGYTPLDSDQYVQIIRIGEEAIVMDYPAKLSALSLSDADYSRYMKSIKMKDTYSNPVIDRIEIDNPTYLDDRMILANLRAKTGDILDFEQLDEDIKSIYNLMIFDDVKYDIITIDGVTTLKISTTPSWDINGQIKFAFGFEDNFDGHSDYSVKFEYIMFGLNSYGGEWRNRFTIGIEKLIYTELYQPLDVQQQWYLRPNIFYRDRKLYVSPTIIGDHTISADLDDSITVQAKEYGGGAGFGVNLANDFQVEAGIVSKVVKPALDMIVSSSTTGTEYISIEEKQNIVEMYARVSLDTLDDAYFPTKGYTGEISFTRQIPEWGSDADFSQFYGEISASYTSGNNTFLPLIKMGRTFHKDDFDSTEDVSSFYTLGGLFNLSGLPTNAVSGDQMLFGSLQYQYRLSQNDLFGALSVPIYAGFSLEAGETWYEEYGQEFESSNIIYAGSVYVAADTILGPFYLGVGAAEGEYYSIYLSLGQTF